MEELKKNKFPAVAIVSVIAVVAAAILIYVFIGSKDVEVNSVNSVVNNSTSQNNNSSDAVQLDSEVINSTDGKLVFRGPKDWKIVNDVIIGDGGFGPAACKLYSPTTRPCLNVRYSDTSIEHSSEYFGSTMSKITDDTKEIGGTTVKRYVSRVDDSAYPVQTIYQYDFPLSGGYVELYAEDTSRDVNPSLIETLESIIPTISKK